jgi:hypothetical protein
MKRLNFELLTIGLTGIAAGIAILALVAWDYRNFQSLPSIPPTPAMVEELKGMHLASLRFIGFIAAAMMLFGMVAVSNLQRRRKAEHTK